MKNSVGFNDAINPKGLRLSRNLSILIFLFVLAGCRGADYWLARLDAEPAYKRALQLRHSDGCSRSVPVEYGQTFPVPVREPTGQFKVLFYPVFHSANQTRIGAPVAEGTLGLDTAANDKCARLPVRKNGSRDLGPAVPPGTPRKEYYRRAEMFFDSLVPVANLYSGGIKPGLLDKVVLNRFAESFLAISEPQLTKEYYRLNPDFWDWLRLHTRQSIALPQGEGTLSKVS